jgi:hypothetical protein
VSGRINYKTLSRAQSAPTSYTGVVGDPDTTVSVERDGGHLTRTPRAVLVVPVVSWHWVIVIIIYVGAGMLVLQQTGSQVSAIEFLKLLLQNLINSRLVDAGLLDRNSVWTCK